jgi:hypothetical protein
LNSQTASAASASPRLLCRFDLSVRATIDNTPCVAARVGAESAQPEWIGHQTIA